MLDSNFTKIFFTLLRSGLWQQDVDDLSCFPITESEWDIIYKVAKEQTVDGIVYDGIQKLPAQFFPPKELLLTWVVKLNRIEQDNLYMDKVISEQVKFFGKIGVSPILLKGQAVGSYYPIKNHRICGDIDWYFDNKESREIVKQKLRKYGVPYTESKFQSISYQWKRCEIEQHAKLFDVFNPFARRKLERIITERLNADFYAKSRVHEYYELPADLNIVQVNLHILKHLLSFGLGLRQICDSAILYSKLNNKYNKAYIFELYSDVKVIKWVYVLHDLLVRFIGLEKSKLPFELDERVSSDWMLKDILMTGNFGFYDSEFVEFDSIGNFKRKKKSVKLWYSFRRYFPLAPYEALGFPILHFLDKIKFLKIG